MQDDGTTRAEEVYLDYLARDLRGEGLDFAALCQQHPELAGELRGLHAAQAALGELRARAGAAGDVRAGAMHELVDALRGPGRFGQRFDRGPAIGGGGQGDVIEVHERALRRRVAMKTLRRELAERVNEADSAPAKQELARFLAEAQITAQLDHPGIASVHEVGVDDEGRPYFTMTRVRGNELAEVFRLSRLGSGDWPLVRCVGLLSRVCETMAYAHSRGVVHRDLKPANVMVGEYGEVVVMDWGFARVLPGGREDFGTGERVRTVRDTGEAAHPRGLLDTLPRENLGTVHYTAPEVAREGARAAGPAADVYAVGAMLHELLTGRPPYWSDAADESHARVLERIRRGPPAPPHRDTSGAPAELTSICERAMARDVSERYADMAELSRDLQAFLEGRVVRAHASGAWAELRTWVRRNRALAGALSAVLLVAAVGLAVIALIESRARQRLDLEADLYRLPYLERLESSLWPEVPEMIPALDRWLETGEALAERRGRHARRLAKLREGALQSGEGIGEDAPPRFADAKDQLQHDALAAAVRELEAFSAPGGLLSRLRERREWARTLGDSTLGAHADAWERARSAVRATDGTYDGLEIPPQLGLVPLGPDPDTGLEEFGHPRSGALPARTPHGLAVDESTGLVFVLLPGGVFHMGAQRDDPQAPGFDAGARPEEGPVREVRVAPLLISKYELTQGQWQRLTGEQPSFVRGDQAEGGPEGSHPVEGVSWGEAAVWLPRLSMRLPSEAEWEYAARAGTMRAFLASESAPGIAESLNLADATVVRAGLDWPQARGMAWLDDGFVRHAPVGTFAPNDFGLHEVLGNVWEWCLEGTAETDSVDAAPAGEAQGVARGGGFINNDAFARVSIRDTGRSQSYDSAYHGLRPVHRLRTAD